MSEGDIKKGDTVFLQAEIVSSYCASDPKDGGKYVMVRVRGLPPPHSMIMIRQEHIMLPYTWKVTDEPRQ